jgi:hypothetical protein
MVLFMPAPLKVTVLVAEAPVMALSVAGPDAVYVPALTLKVTAPLIPFVFRSEIAPEKLL